MTVTDCERVQAAWYRACAETADCRVWEDEGLLWTDGPDGLNLMFPRALKPGPVRRGLDHAREHGRPIVGAWLGLDVDPAALAEAGFERGWSPWWMTASLVDLAAAADPRVRLDDGDVGPDADDHRGDGRRLARLEPVRAWHATARLADGSRAGGAWSFRDGSLAGVFDMWVPPQYRRQGLGSALLGAVCAAARADGAEHAVLNATPEGKRLYETRGFRQIGEGITWWHHMGNT